MSLEKKITVNLVRIIASDNDFLNRKLGSRGEIYYDKQANTLRLMDGTTTGGLALARSDLSNITNANFLAKAQAAGVGGGAGSDYDFTLVADDSTGLTVESGNTVKILGGTGIDTSVNIGASEIQISNSGTSFYRVVASDNSTTLEAASLLDTLTIVGSGGISVTGNSGTKTITIDASGVAGGGGGGGNSFTTIAVAGQSNVVADSASDTLTLVAGGGMTITTSAAGDSITFASSAGASNFSSLTDASTASLTVDKFYLPAITKLTVSNNGASSYLFDQYSGNNPTIYAISGTTIAFSLQIAGHPFVIQNSAGVNYDTGLYHVASDGTVSTGSNAQGKTSGTLYWKIPATTTGNYRYQCTLHAPMVGTITIKNFVSI